MTGRTEEDLFPFRPPPVAIQPSKLFRILLDDPGRKGVGYHVHVLFGRPSGDFNTRVARALALLEDLGGEMEAKVSDGKLVLHGRGCPLSEAVAVEPRTCKFMETLLAELTGAKVEERCDRGTKRRCGFVISPEEKEKPS